MSRLIDPEIWYVDEQEILLLYLDLANYKNQRHNNGDIITISCQYNDIKETKLLLKDKKIDPSIYNNYCIRYCVENGFLDIVRELMKDPRVDLLQHDPKYSDCVKTAENRGFINVANFVNTVIKINPKLRKYYIENKENQIVKELNSFGLFN